MEATILRYDNLHLHGPLFVNLFRARHEAFVKGLGWDLPQQNGMEFDQYDTPQSCWIAVHEGERILAGFRITRTTAKCAAYTYMIKDAQDGKLPTIPTTLLHRPAPVDASLWECSRAFVDETLPGPQRNLVRRAMIESFLPSVQKVNGKGLVTLTNRLWKKWMPMHGIRGSELGPMTRIDDQDYQVVLMTPLKKAKQAPKSTRKVSSPNTK